ncbi:MAG: dephospho-CoA kinase, partial [Lachnospiraceae bacterium]|nr:dephospho-CoA kinase [Lachnospiraceae bacterium]
LNNFYEQKELIAEKIVENTRKSGKLDKFFNFENILDTCNINEDKNNKNNYYNLSKKNNNQEDIFRHIEQTCNFTKKRRTYYNKKMKSNLNNILEFFEDLIIVESALPSEDMFNICDKMIYIDCSYENRVSRLKKSRKYSDEKIKQIFDSQQYYEEFYNRCEYKILNDGSKKELINKVDEVMNEIYIACKQ